MPKTGISGDREVVNALRSLSNGLPMADVDKAAVKSMQPMLQDAKNRARGLRNFAGKHPGFPDPRSPRKGGHLDEGLDVRKTTSTRAKRSYWLGAVRRALKIAHLVEFGTAPHFQPHFRGGFLHPGARRQPFMTPAYEEHADDVPESFGKNLWQILSRRVAEIARTGR